MAPEKQQIMSSLAVPPKPICCHVPDAFLLMMLGIELQVKIKFIEETVMEILKQPPTILDVSIIPFLILHCSPVPCLHGLEPKLSKGRQN